MGDDGDGVGGAGRLFLALVGFVGPSEDCLELCPAKTASPSPSMAKLSCGGDPGGVIGPVETDSSPSSPVVSPLRLGRWLANRSGMSESPRLSMNGLPKCTVSLDRALVWAESMNSPVLGSKKDNGKESSSTDHTGEPSAAVLAAMPP